MASTVWKGYITFGLITIPVRLYAAARTERVGFHQIHSVCGTRIKQQLYCPHCERVVERSEIAKGSEVEKDRYVVVGDEDLKKIAPPSSDNMEILEFVKAEGIDPIYFDASYFIVASNLFGDILSDVSAAVTGSIGLAASANIDPTRRFPSMFEPVHGSAPDIAGKGVANPLAAILSAGMMLDHFGLTEAAAKINAAVRAVLAEESVRTPDLGGTNSTAEMTAAVKKAAR